MCAWCNKADNDFVLLNETSEYSGIEIALNRQGVLRIRYYDQGEYDMLFTQDIINVNFCPICGRKFMEE